MGSKNKNKKPIASAPEPPTNAGGGGGNRGHKLITDPRFAFSQTDPKFEKNTKHKSSKVSIDSRFNRMFTDEDFSTSSARVDKRGKIKQKDAPNPLKHYYRMDEEDEGENQDEEAVKDDVNVDGSRELSYEEEEKERERKLKKVWDKLSDSESESELEQSGDEDDVEVASDSDGSSSDSDFDTDDEAYSVDEEIEENVPEIDKETSRLAVMHMDWNHVRAVDLYVLFSSFLPKDGQVLSVSVHPSEYGLKCMEEEAVHGPVGLFDKENRKEDDDNNNAEVDNVRLRAYENCKLRYYCAVVECDSIATADYLYETLVGVVFERSSNKLDFIQEFKHAPRDVAKEVPANYEPIDFQSRRLQQSKIHLTWDEDEPQRSKTLKRKFNDDQLAELELKEFLATDESESDEDENDNATEDRSGKRRKKQDMYRALIQSGDGSDGDEEEEEEDGQDMEVTFNTGFEDISKKMLEKKDKKSETVWEAYQRKKKEKKKARKNRSKGSDDDDSDTDQEPTEGPDDFFVEKEPTNKEKKEVRGKSGKKGNKAAETAEAAASRAELELLLVEDDGENAGVKGYNLKYKKGKGKKGKDILDEEKIPTVDYDDDRFSSLFASHLFALDPTDPQFKRSAAHARQIAQKKHTEESNKQKAQARVHNGMEPGKDEPVQAEELRSKTDKYEISALVKCIKMKSQRIPAPANGKKSGKKGQGI